jgi:hypothetical protein
LTIKATGAVLKTKEMMPCAVAVRRMVLSVMPTSETYAVSMVCATVAVARKLAGILHRMWVSEADFHVGFGAKVTQRLRLRPVQ